MAFTVRLQRLKLILSMFSRQHWIKLDYNKSPFDKMAKNNHPTL